MSEQLSKPAHLALGSLHDHPHLNTAEAINTGPHSVDQIDLPQIVEGLAELEARGLARESDGAWELTGAGRASAV
jgi:hypothetical protein